MWCAHSVTRTPCSHHPNTRLPLTYYFFVQRSSWMWAFGVHSPREKAASSTTPLRWDQRAEPAREAQNRCCMWIILTSVWKHLPYLINTLCSFLWDNHGVLILFSYISAYFLLVKMESCKNKSHGSAWQVCVYLTSQYNINKWLNAQILNHYLLPTQWVQ